ncbi:uncharacterized protein LOC127251117 isoform X3 [Andrographis paniculata]|uniref:uncharacterized protein LOC127251117 isoform X3 n=1 Tax=Andrographis paniculata TaxID=175694 RepID=UPI0021E8618E|nr:uncharacterized protein LOC127251117 isoform X3 [Andrographis paniculata]
MAEFSEERCTIGIIWWKGFFCKVSRVLIQILHTNNIREAPCSRGGGWIITSSRGIGGSSDSSDDSQGDADAVESKNCSGRLCLQQRRYLAKSN